MYTQHKNLWLRLTTFIENVYKALYKTAFGMLGFINDFNFQTNKNNV